MYKYETHLHTSPVSKCGKASVKETVEFYKSLGYDGIFITNHFLDGNVNIDRNLPYEEKIDFYFSDYEEGVKLGNEIGLKVFLGVELAYKGTDFLVYGLSKEWFLQHPEILDMKKSDELKLMMDSGALVIHAHPYREASYIDHISGNLKCKQDERRKRNGGALQKALWTSGLRRFRQSRSRQSNPSCRNAVRNRNNKRRRFCKQSKKRRIKNLFNRTVVEEYYVKHGNVYEE